MALVLSLRPGHDFFVGTERFLVLSAEGETEFTLLHVGKDKKHEVTDAFAQEVLPEVFVSAGSNPHDGMVKAVISAPRHIRVLRGDKARAIEEER